jgi:hypothetical protein
MEPVVTGTDKLITLSRRLKEAGRKDLQKELTKGISASLNPLRRDLRESARNNLPKKGGLNENVAKLRFTVSRRDTPKGGGIRLIAKNAYQIRRMDEPGVVRHPVFKRKGEEGRNQVWEDQKIRPGWATNPFLKQAAPIRQDVEQAMDRVIKKIDGGF